MAGEKWSVLLPWWQHGRDTWNHFPYHVPDYAECSDSRPHSTPLQTISQLPIGNTMEHCNAQLWKIELHIPPITHTLWLMLDGECTLFNMSRETMHNTGMYSHACFTSWCTETRVNLAFLPNKHSKENCKNLNIWVNKKSGQKCA